MVRLVPNCGRMSRSKGDRISKALFSKQMYNKKKYQVCANKLEHIKYNIYEKKKNNVRNLFCGKQYQITL